MQISNMILKNIQVRSTPPAPPAPTELLTNPSFENGTTGWTAASGFVTYSINSASKPAVYANTVYMSYVENNNPISQTVNIANIGSYSNITGTINIQHTQNDGDGGNSNNYTSIDTYYFQLQFLAANNSVLKTVRTPTSGTTNAPRYATDVSLSLTSADPVWSNVAKVKFEFGGKDTGFWNGNWGPRVFSANLNVT